MKGYPGADPGYDSCVWSHTTAAANTAVVVTLTPDTGERICIDEMVTSYAGGTLSGGKITIAGAATYYEVDITALGPIPSMTKIPVIGAVDEVITVTLAAGGTNVVGKVNLGRRP